MAVGSSYGLVLVLSRLTKSSYVSEVRSLCDFLDGS